MTLSFVGLGVVIVLTSGLLAYWALVVRAHQRRIEQLDVRIHVNGIRGKSTVTRLVAGVLREGGYVTVGKTTGSAARVLGPLGEEYVIHRRGAATINEQIDVVADHVRPGVEALVIECMAVRPLYQEYSQNFMVRSDITIITNVRLDHQEEMGETLEEIADSLSATIPQGGVLITAEDRPHLRERLRRNAEARSCRFVHADPARVADADMKGFDYLQFKENVAIGLAVAELLGIARHRAVEGMWKAVPDVGVVRLTHHDIGGKQVMWVPMFAANDKESVVLTLDTLATQFADGATVIGVLNNRQDRGRRAELFAAMVPEDIGHHFDHIITFGAYEEMVTRTIVAGGYPAERVHNLGDSVDPPLETILAEIAGMVTGPSGVLIGMVNIHTHQAELLMEHFAHSTQEVDELEASRDPRRAPGAVVRARNAAAQAELAPSPRADQVRRDDDPDGDRHVA